MDQLKRRFLAQAALASAGALWPVSVLAATRRETPIMDIGPFYPIEKPIDQDADLTMIKGHSDRAKGQLLDLVGRVITVEGKPVANARIELWQANAVGRYSHRGDTHDAPLDPNFEGYGEQRTDGEGRFRFLTVKPGAYPAGPFLRAPHIHFDITAKVDRLITQMYFPGDPLLKQDRVLAGNLLSNSMTDGFPTEMFGRLETATKPGPLPVTCLFDIVLPNG